MDPVLIYFRTSESVTTHSLTGFIRQTQGFFVPTPKSLHSEALCSPRSGHGVTCNRNVTKRKKTVAFTSKKPYNDFVCTVAVLFFICTQFKEVSKDAFIVQVEFIASADAQSSVRMEA